MKKLPSSKAPSCAVDKYIGTDFDHVVNVSKEMESVKEVAEVTEHIVVTGSNIEAIKTVATNIGDVNNVSDNMEYVKDVAAGIEGLPVVSYIGSEPPAQPVEGATWYCTTDGRTYVWYKDTDSYQWVESSPQSIAKDDVRTPIVARAALERALLLDGYTLVTGSFELGATLTKATDVILQEVTGKVYSWGGAFPANVPTGSTPDSTGGIGSNTWALQGVNYNLTKQLRDELIPRIEAEEADTQDWKGFTDELLAQADIPDDGQPDELGKSKRVEAILEITKSHSRLADVTNPNSHPASAISRGASNVDADLGSLELSVSANASGIASLSATDQVHTAKIAALESGQGSGVVGYATRAELFANLNFADRSVGYVTNDATPTYNGTYRKSGASGTGSWVQASNDIASETYQLATLAKMNSNAAALTDVYPNLLKDPTGQTGFDGIITPVNIGGVKGIRVTNGRSHSISEYDLSKFSTGYVNCSVEVTEYFAGTGGDPRMLLLQYDAIGEIDRQTAPIIRNGQYTLSAAIKPEAMRVMLLVSTTSDRTFVASNFSLADGSIKGFRAGSVTAEIAAMTVAEFTPNLVIKDLTKWDSAGRFDIRPVWSIERNAPSYDVLFKTGAPAYISYTVQASKIKSGMFSASLRVNSATTSNPSKLLVVQYNSSKVEVARAESQISAAVVQTTLELSKIPLHPNADTITYFVGAGGTVGAGFNFSEMVLRDGAVSTYAPELQPTAWQYNLFSNPSLDVFGVAFIAATPAKMIATGANGVYGCRYRIPATGELSELKTPIAAITIENILFDGNRTSEGFKLDIIYEDASGAEISRQAGVIIGYSSAAPIKQSIQLNIPAGTKTIQYRPTITGSVACPVSGVFSGFEMLKYSTENRETLEFPVATAATTATKAMYVSSLGNDDNDGTVSNPLLSINAAANKLGGAGIVYVADDGVYPVQTISAGNIHALEIVGTGNTKPVIRATSGRKTGWTLEAGETNVWWVTTADISGVKRWIWEADVEDDSTFITDEERENQHAGRTHRLEHTKLYYKSSLAELKASSHGCFHDGTKLYVKPYSTYVSIEDAFITYPTGTGLGVSNGGSVRLVNFKVEFAGIVVSGCKHAEIVNCESIGSAGQGITANNVVGIMRNCRTAAAVNDGCNYHNTLDVQVRGVVFDCYNTWSHDNGDDGDSMHEHCVGTYYGGLYEYNQDRGIAPSYGSHTTYHNVKTKHNGYLQTPSTSSFGEGIGLVGGNSEVGTNGTSVTCYGCVDVGSNFGFANHGVDASSGQVSTMRLYDCKSLSSKAAAYSAKSGANLETFNCSEQGALGVIKHTEGGGIITVVNLNVLS